jgi:hypothetical protein
MPGFSCRLFYTYPALDDKLLALYGQWTHDLLIFDLGRLVVKIVFLLAATVLKPDDKYRINDARLFLPPVLYLSSAGFKHTAVKRPEILRRREHTSLTTLIATVKDTADLCRFTSSNVNSTTLRVRERIEATFHKRLVRPQGSRDFADSSHRLADYNEGNTRH